jgi:hypothetical protein
MVGQSLTICVVVFDHLHYSYTAWFALPDKTYRLFTVGIIAGACKKT